MQKSVIYKIRRKCQVVAHNLFGNEAMSKIYFRIILKRKLNLKNPTTFNEKLQWLKLFYWPNNEKAIICADKYKVREYLIEKGYGEYVNELYGVWESADDIEWDSLPEQFVLKCNHGCGYNILCNDKSQLDTKKTEKQLDKWLKEDFSKFNAEPHYGRIKPYAICEKYLGGNIVNYNIFCCNGEPKFFSVIEGLSGGTDEALTYYYADGRKAEFYSAAYPQSEKPLPECLNKMKELATEISKEFPFVRVDFFEIDGKIIFSELTFTPGGALIPFAPPEFDAKLGGLLNISNEMKDWSNSNDRK